MSGDQRTDEPDPLDDDFVIEDLAGKNDDLESLFTAPGKAPASKPAGSPPDEDDVLFTDHTQGLNPSEKFQPGKTFAEENKSQWSGDNLELEQAGVPEAELKDAEESFTSELGSLLQSEEEFGPDSEKELELVDGGGTGGGTADGVNEFEQSGPFVLDDSEGAWQEDNAAAASAESGDEAVAEGDEPGLVEDETPVEPGWEPLPEKNVDELSEVGEVERTEGEAQAGAEPELADASAELEGVDGHDIYAEETPAPALVGARPGGRRVLRMMMSIAASLLVLAGAAVVVLRPEWFGLAFEPARVQQVHIDRPQVQMPVTTPPVVATPPPVTTDPGTTGPVTTGPVTTDPVTTDPVSTDPAATHANDPGPVVAPPVDVTPVEPPPVTTPETEQKPLVTEAPSNPWPVQERRPSEPVVITGKEKDKALVRVGDDLMAGETETGAREVRAVDGVLPGSRAFAQLHNGNYFIGSVKMASDNAVTLRLEHGEITIATADIARLTELGSADYEQLQRATSGFVRLTNNNRLVGGILSQIADDHIILEFRSNRVMLPKSAIGQVVKGEDEGGVRLDVTPQEDDWLKTMAERQLGSGTGATAAGPEPAPVQGRPAPPTAPTTTPTAPAPRPVPPSPPRAR